MEVLIQELPGRLYPKRKPEQITQVVIHHAAAGEQGRDHRYYRQFVNTVSDWHRNKHKWRRIGYPYVIDPLGVCYKCNPYLTVTNHAKGGNTDGIGVMLIGNFETDTPTDAQLATARALVQELKASIPTLAKVCGHRDVKGSRTVCPGASCTDDMIAALW